MAGRKPTPTHIKLLKGNPGKRALPRREPKPTRGVPTMPSHLSARAKAAWKAIGPELDRMGVLTLADGKALELLCDAYAEYRAAREIVERDGMTYESVSQHGTMWRTRPEVPIASDAYRRVAAMLREFGLTPSARTKVQTAGGSDKPDNPFAELVG
jgi:P27 family predicted phage terminase small subunit